MRKRENPDVREHGRSSSANKFGVSLLEPLGLAKHSRVFETSGLVSEQGLNQECFKSLNRISTEIQ